MQIALGRRGDYSVRALIDLARHHGQRRRKAREIALAMDIPERFLPQLLAPFVRQGLVLAVAGPEGGYSLAVPPGDIDLLTAVEIAEGPIESPECVLQGGPCDWKLLCPVHDAWGRARQALASELRRTSFADLAAIDAAIEQGDQAQPSGPLHPITVERRGVRDGVAAPLPGRKPAGGRGRKQ